jgi:signal transduction histidine kinase
MFIAISLPFVAAGWFGIRSTTSALKRQTELILRVASNGAEAQLREFLLHLKEETLALSVDGKMRNALEAGGPDDSHNVSEILISLRQRIPEAREIFVLTKEGRVAASSEPANAGRDRSSIEYFVEGQKSFFAGDVVRRPDGETTWVMSAPIRNATADRVLGVLAVRLEPPVLSELTIGRRILREGADTQSFRIGETGETYIVNRERLMITESRDIPDSVLKVKVDTLPVRTALEKGQEMTGDYSDYRGILVSGASVILREPGWIMLTEIDFSQAFAPIRRLRNVLVGLMVGLSVGGIMLAGTWAREIVRPLRMVSEADLALAGGDEARAMASEENLPTNEIGEFVRRRNDRVKALMERQGQLVLEQKRSAEAAAELERMSYSIVHDMRAPLRAIVTFGDLVEAEAAGKLSEEARGYLARMRGAATRMDRLISDMLSYSALVRGQLPLHPVNVAKLVDGVIETYPSLRAHKHEIRVSPDLPVVRGNEAALTQCFSSLLDNALKFVRPGQSPKVAIRAERSNGMVKIFVEDEGVGIARHLQDKLFGIFQRGTSAQEGTGIGLAMVRIAAARMGGRVGVNSEEGQGSRFWIELTLYES